jgi:hypothetical protein
MLDFVKSFETFLMKDMDDLMELDAGIAPLELETVIVVITVL